MSPAMTIHSHTRTLPPEIILPILQCVDLIRDDDNQVSHTLTMNTVQPILRTAIVLNKMWNSLVPSLLYKHICISSSAALSRLATTLSNRKQYREHVRSVFFTRFFDESGQTHLSFANRKALDEIHSLCPHLHVATVRRKDVQTKAMFSQERLSPSHPLSNGKINKCILTRLEIEGFPTATDGFRDVHLPVLQEFILMRFQHNGAHPYHTIQFPTMPVLQRLCFRDCSILGLRMPFPRSCPNLRILEVEGGELHVNHLWEDLEQLVSHCRLELLTLAPQHLSWWPVDGDMTSLASLTHLRISFCDCCNGPYEALLPAKLEHLVVGHPCHQTFESSLPKLETLIETVLEKKADGHAYPCLRTVTIHTKTHRSFQWNAVGLGQKAARAGVKLGVHYHGMSIHTFNINYVNRSKHLIFRP